MEDNFFQMVERIIGASNLEITGGKLEQAIINEANHDQKSVEEYINQFKPLWINFTKAKGPHLISTFLESVGSQICFEYLTKLFPFNPSRLTVKVRKGKSNVDAHIEVNYLCDYSHLMILKQLKEKYNLTHIADENEMAKLIVSNCIKTLTRFLSNIMNIKYRLFTAQINLNLNEDKNLELYLLYDGRIG